jgi:hypothetical protein
MFAGARDAVSYVTGKIWPQVEKTRVRQPTQNMQVLLKKADANAEAKLKSIDIKVDTYNQACTEHRNLIVTEMAKYQVQLKKLEESFSAMRYAGAGALFFGFVSWTTAGLAVVAYVALGKHQNFLQFRENYLAFHKIQNQLLEIYRWIFKNGPQATADHNVIQLVKLLAPNVIEKNVMVPPSFKLDPQHVNPQFFHALKGTVHEVPENVLLLMPDQYVIAEEKKAAEQPSMAESVTNKLVEYVPGSVRNVASSVVKSTLFHRLCRTANHVVYGCNAKEESKIDSSLLQKKMM